MRHLVVKFGAPGDALRTTPFVRRLKAEGPCDVTWISDAASADVLAACPLVDRLLVAGPAAEAIVEAETFDAVWSLDEDPAACALAARARAPLRRGLGRDAGGALVPLNPEAAYMARLPADDDLKFRRNRKTVPEIQFEACGRRFEGERYAFEVGADDRAAARAALARVGGPGLVLLHVGCGGRWPTKAWPAARWGALAADLARAGARAVVAAGPDERARIEEVLAAAGGAAAALPVLPALPVRAFAAALLGAEALVAADSLAMHLSIAVRRPVVALFCPTSAAEIEFYGFGEALVSPEGPCYKGSCPRWPACMERIEVDEVLAAIARRRRPAEDP